MSCDEIFSVTSTLSIQAVHFTHVVVTDSAHCSVFFVSHYRCTFTRVVHVVLLFLTNRRVRDENCKPGGPASLYRLESYSTNQTLNAEFTG